MSESPTPVPSVPDDVAPALAWQQFIDLVNDPAFIAERSSEDLIALLDPFLTNPARHKRHVKMIVEASQATRVGQMIRKLYGPAYPLMRKLLRNRGMKQQRELRNKLEALERDLTETVQPADVAVDVLPLRSLDTPEDWVREGHRLRWLQIKAAVNPKHSLMPTSFSLRLQILSDGVRFADHYPHSEFEQVGTQEIGFSEEGKFVTSRSGGASLGGSIGAGGLGLTAAASTSDSTEVSASKASSQKLTFTPTVRKIQSSAVGNTASWQLLASDQSAPVGGLDFFVSLLVEEGTRVVQASISIDAAFDGWGPLRLDHAAQIKVSDAPPSR